jgi:hypothetical protein
LGGVTHQFVPDRYKQVIKELTAANEICQRAQQGDAQFWQESFARLQAR